MAIQIAQSYVPKTCMFSNVESTPKHCSIIHEVAKLVRLEQICATSKIGRNCGAQSVAKGVFSITFTHFACAGKAGLEILRCGCGGLE